MKKVPPAHNFMFRELLEAGEFEGLGPKETITRATQRYRELPDAEKEVSLQSHGHEVLCLSCGKY